jgi:outer membrane protein TolC
VASARDAALARQQVQRAGWALLTPSTSPDDAVTAALLSSPELWRGLEQAGVSVAEFGRRWSAARQPGAPERRVAQLAELSATGRGGGRALRESLIRDLAADVRRRVVRWQAAQRSAELQATLVRSFQAAGSLPASGSSVNQAAERAAAQRARLELVRLSTEIEAERRALASLMGLPERNDQWAPAPGPPDVPPRLGPGRAEIGVDESIARALRDRADIGEARRQVQASDPRAPGRAGFEAREARRRLADLEAAARARVREAHGRMAGARLVAEAAREALLPMHERIVDVSLDRFNAGLVDASELVASQRELVAARRQQTDALRDYWSARIDLDRAMGF